MGHQRSGAEGLLRVDNPMNAAADRRRSDDAVRRIRAESARRIDRTGRVRAFSSWCALATLAGAISLAALDAHEMRMRERAEAEVVAQQTAVEKSRLGEKLRAIQLAAQEPRS